MPQSPVVSPSIITANQGQMALMSYLLRNRIIFLKDWISLEVATQLCAQLMALDAMDSTQDIKLYINCNGGTHYGVVAIIEAMQALRADVSTIVFGSTLSQSTLVLAAGTKGKRFAMPNSRIHMEAPTGGVQGSAYDVKPQAEELNRQYQIWVKFLSQLTGQDEEECAEISRLERYMGAQQALEFGLIDGIIE